MNVDREYYYEASFLTSYKVSNFDHYSKLLCK